MCPSARKAALAHEAGVRSLREPDGGPHSPCRRRVRRAGSMTRPPFDRAEAANREVLDRVAAARPVLLDIRRAGEVIPSLGTHDLLHAGPPLNGWQEACGALRGAASGTLMLSNAVLGADSAMTAAGSAPWVLRSGAESNALVRSAASLRMRHRCSSCKTP